MSFYHTYFHFFIINFSISTLIDKIEISYSNDGFTLKKILSLVRKTSIDAATYDIISNPQNWVDGVTSKDAWVNNAIVSDIGLQQYGNNIYVSLEN